MCCASGYFWRRGCIAEHRAGDDVGAGLRRSVACDGAVDGGVHRNLCTMPKRQPIANDLDAPRILDQHMEVLCSQPHIPPHRLACFRFLFFSRVGTFSSFQSRLITFLEFASFSIMCHNFPEFFKIIIIINAYLSLSVMKLIQHIIGFISFPSLFLLILVQHHLHPCCLHVPGGGGAAQPQACLIRKISNLMDRSPGVFLLRLYVTGG